MAKKTKTCFVIAPIGEANSEVRHRSDQIFRHIIAPAVESRGYKASRADLMTTPGLITSQIISQLLEADLVIADLTDHNPNVFYELAIRHAVRKPIVQIIHASNRLPFDVSSQRTISFDHNDLDSAAKCRIDIEEQIQAVEADPGNADNPLSASIDLQSMRESNNPVEQALATLVSTVNDLRAEVADVQHHIRSQHTGFLSSSYQPVGPQFISGALESYRPVLTGYLDALPQIKTDTLNSITLTPFGTQEPTTNPDPPGSTDSKAKRKLNLR